MWSLIEKSPAQMNRLISIFADISKSLYLSFRKVSKEDQSLIKYDFDWKTLKNFNSFKSKVGKNEFSRSVYVHPFQRAPLEDQKLKEIVLPKESDFAPLSSINIPTEAARSQKVSAKPEKPKISVVQEEEIDSDLIDDFTCETAYSQKRSNNNNHSSVQSGFQY